MDDSPLYKKIVAPLHSGIDDFPLDLGSMDMIKDSYPCPDCGAPTLKRPCTGLFCNGGQVEIHSENECGACDICEGDGYLEWCSNTECGWDKNRTTSNGGRL